MFIAVCEGQIQLLLVLDRGVVRGYQTPDSFTVPRSEWALLMLTCDGHNGHKVVHLVYYRLNSSDGRKVQWTCERDK